MVDFGQMVGGVSVIGLVILCYAKFQTKDDCVSKHTLCTETLNRRLDEHKEDINKRLDIWRNDLLEHKNDIRVELGNTQSFLNTLMNTKIADLKEYIGKNGNGGR